MSSKNNFHVDNQRKNHPISNSEGTCLASAMLIILFMPIVGIYYIFAGDEGEKVIGVLLLFIGIAIWVAYGGVFK